MTLREQIVRLAGRGDGVTETGRYVPRAAPGDGVLIDGDHVILEPGPHHVAPACRHYGQCGGCQMQHVDTETYASWAVARIAYTLGQHGLTVPEMEPVHLSPPHARRRIALRARRQGRRLSIGYNSENSHTIVDLEECPVMCADLFALIAPLRELLLTVLADRQTVGLSLTMAGNGVDLMISNMAADTLSVIEALTGFANAYDLARLSVEDSHGVSTVAERRAPEIMLGGVAVGLPPSPFLQATADGEAALVQAVQTMCIGARTIADLFCGLGTFALPLSAQARILAVDAAGPAVAALLAAGKRSGRQLLTRHRDLFRNPLRPDELKAFDAVVIDPPRAGAKEQCQQLAQSAVPLIAAVSCNPATFGRDARILADGGYRLERLWPVAQFRWSNHIELAALFRRD